MLKNNWGIDPSLVATGICITDETGQVRHEEVIKTGKMRGLPRLLFIKKRILELLELYPTTKIAIEGYAFGARGRAIFSLGELGGVIRVALLEANTEVLEVAPSQLKKFITGKGNADKDEMKAVTLIKFNRDYKDDNICDAHGLSQFLRAS